MNKMVPFIHFKPFFQQDVCGVHAHIGWHKCDKCWNLNFHIMFINLNINFAFGAFTVEFKNE